MMSERQIKEKHDLAVLKTWCVQNLGLTYQSKLCVMIDQYRDAMVPELMSDLEDVVRVESLLTKIRSAQRVRS
jgi:hypothetical protein